MNYKGFHVRHICKQRENGQRFREGSRLFLTSLYLKGEDGCASLWIIAIIQFFLSPLELQRKRREEDKIERK